MGPFVVSIMGLKKSGKTTVSEALIASLSARGYRVGSVKSMVRSSFTFDVKGKDTCRLGDAGAEFVVSLSRDETVYLERHDGGRRGIEDITRFFPPRVQFLICEGLEDPATDQVQICCLREIEDLPEAMRVRGLDPARMIAISGLIASVTSEHLDLPVFDVTNSEGREGLADLVIRHSGSRIPAGESSGPLVENKGWEPGQLPPGVFPEVPDPRN